MPTDVFISYATPDLEFVTRLHQYLTGRGFAVWFDHDNNNNELGHRTENHKVIQEARVFLLVQSPVVFELIKVREEISRAVNNYAKPFVLLAWQPVTQPPRAWQSLLLRTNQRLEFNGQATTENFEKLVAALRRFVPAEMVSPSSASAPRPGGRRLSALSPQKESSSTPLNPLALGAQVISGVITPLDLVLAEQEQLSEEIKWLFKAIDHLLKVQSGQFERTTPIDQAIPLTARRNETVDNHLLAHLTGQDLDDLTGPFRERVTPLTRLDTQLNRNLKHLLERETAMGEAGRGDAFLQSQIKDNRLEIAKILQELAKTAQQAYGVLVTGPDRLITILGSHLNPIALGVEVITAVITPLPDLSAEDKAFVSDEIKWLFSAAHTYQQVYQAVQKALLAQGKISPAELSRRLPGLRQQEIDSRLPVPVTIPPDTPISSTATNRLLRLPDKEALDFYLDIRGDQIYGPLKGEASSLLEQLTSELNGLNGLRQREIKMGEEGQRNVQLQNQIQTVRLNIVQLLHKLARLMATAYDISITTPEQLVEILEQ